MRARAALPCPALPCPAPPSPSRPLPFPLSLCSVPFLARSLMKCSQTARPHVASSRSTQPPVDLQENMAHMRMQPPVKIDEGDVPHRGIYVGEGGLSSGNWLHWKTDGQRSCTTTIYTSHNSVKSLSKWSLGFADLPASLSRFCWPSRCTWLIVGLSQVHNLLAEGIHTRYLPIK